MCAHDCLLCDIAKADCIAEQQKKRRCCLVVERRRRSPCIFGFLDQGSIGRIQCNLLRGKLQFLCVLIVSDQITALNHTVMDQMCSYQEYAVRLKYSNINEPTLTEYEPLFYVYFREWNRFGIYLNKNRLEKFAQNADKAYNFLEDKFLKWYGVDEPVEAVNYTASGGYSTAWLLVSVQVLLFTRCY